MGEYADMHVTIDGEEKTTPYLNIFLPGYGDVSLRFEKSDEYGAELTLSFSGSAASHELVRIVDQSGNDRTVT